jgi:hypothetical protein
VFAPTVPARGGEKERYDAMRRPVKTLILALLAACSLAIVPSATAASVTFDFPSDDSTVVGSVGFIDADEVGYFWSAARGDLVSETFAGPNFVDRAVLSVEVVQNVLNNGAEVDWDIEINGIVVGSFVVPEGFFGPIVRDMSFPRIVGPMYTVTIRVTNEVAGGEGSHTLAYAGSFAHSIELFRWVPCANQRMGVPCWVDRP